MMKCGAAYCGRQMCGGRESGRKTVWCNLMLFSSWINCCPYKLSLGLSAHSSWSDAIFRH